MALAVFVIFVNIFSIYYFDLSFSSVGITGKVHGVNDTGDLSLYVDGPPKAITIDSPLNTTHNFDKGANYSIDLNVSANFSVDSWRYFLYDLTHNCEELLSNDFILNCLGANLSNLQVYGECSCADYNRDGVVDLNDVALFLAGTSFTPNTSFVAYRWSNKLKVEANETNRDWISKEVVFYVEVPNSAPILGAIDNNIYFCEGARGEYLFNATDVDEQNLRVDISDKDPIYASEQTPRVVNFTVFKIHSGTLDKDDVGGAFSGSKVYSETVSVTDDYNATCCSDTNTTNITVIEINNVPTMVGLGSRTLTLNGTNSSFNHQMDVNDTENGTSSDGQMRFNLSWEGDENYFDINLTTGIMNYTPENGHQGSTYDLTVCVNDTALPSPHANISLCNVTGGVNVVCDDFTITVTDDNRPPVIESYTPIDLSLSVDGTTTTTFTAEVSDADMSSGFYPDIDWYVDGVLKEHNENRQNDSFSYSFGCDVSGNHEVSIVTTDGLLNDTIVWGISVLVVACPVSEGGGGGYLSGVCYEEWGCNNWQVCQNVERSYNADSLSLEDYSDYREICLQNGYDGRFCGFQLNECSDLKNCDNNYFRIPKPTESQVCYYTEDPSCNDRITNCHSGGCELLVDCGGPCQACASCSDGIQNQGEGNIDCGGPCPFLCEAEAPLSLTSYIILILGFLVILALIFILYRIYRIVKKLRSKKSNS